MSFSIKNGPLKLARTTLAISIGIMGYLLFSGLWAKSFLTGSVIIPALILVVAAKKRIPSQFLVIYTLATLMNVICMGQDLYNRVFHMDEVAHFLTSLALAPCLGFLFLADLEEVMFKRPHLFFFLTFTMTLSVGAGWEVLEYLIRIEAYYDDTMTDIIADSLGAVAGSLLAARWSVKNNEA